MYQGGITGGARCADEADGHDDLSGLDNELGCGEEIPSLLEHEEGDGESDMCVERMRLVADMGEDVEAEDASSAVARNCLLRAREEEPCPPHPQRHHSAGGLRQGS